MCNLYIAGPAPQHMRTRWEKQVRDAIEELDSQRIFPGNSGVTARLVDGEPEAGVMQWGFERDFANRPINNARDDKLKGGMWGKAFRERRCVIPVRWFVEWHQFERTPSGKKRILSFQNPDGGYLWMAGLWEDVNGKLNYSMITTSPNDLMTPIHNRMPAILAPDSIDAYLESHEPPFDLIAPYGGDMELKELAKSIDDPNEGMLF
ncbi:MAG: hypothetical protein CMO55_26265 [Verrucomicrobiales bacterium]|nr:hypothetical protein [Verrucomicrobiales bacterium]